MIRWPACSKVQRPSTSPFPPSTPPRLSMWVYIRWAKLCELDHIWLPLPSHHLIIRWLAFMFYEASAFNQDLSFDTAEVTDVRVYSLSQTVRIDHIWLQFLLAHYQMDNMFNGATAFNQNLCNFRDDLTTLPAVMDMFFNTSCPDKSDPASPSGPWCFNCLPLPSLWGRPVCVWTVVCRNNL